MPLRDHFREPFIKRSSWEAIHGGWPMVIVQHLTQRLPADFVAEPRVHLGARVEIDIATFEDESSAGFLSGGEQGGLAIATWAPTKPTLAVPTPLSDFDNYEVRVFDANRDRRLVAAIELISPGNLDRPEARMQFITKCESLLKQEVCVVLVDVVTNRRFNLYAELLDYLGQRDPALGEEPPATSAVTLRWGPRERADLLEIWNYPMVVGKPLPVLPLWLSEKLAVPLDLETTYEQTLKDLRIP